MSDANSNPAEVTSPPPDDGLTRIKITKSFNSHGSGYVLTACIVSMLVAQVLTRNLVNRLAAIVVIIAVTLLGFAMAYWVYSTIRRRRIDAQASSQKGAAIPALAEVLFDGMTRVDVGHRSCLFLHGIQDRSRLNETLAICWHDEVKPVRFAKAPFEPCLIENTESFVAPNSSEPIGSDSGESTFVFEGRAKFFVYALGMISIAVAGIRLIAWLAQSQYWLTGLVYPMNILLLFGFAYWGVWSFLHRDQWLLVPGGVVDRRNCVACVVEMDTQRWMLTVAQNQSVAQRVVTEYQLERFLQAWLSPLSPPSRERFVDLNPP